YTSAALADGGHTISASVSDAAGNLGASNPLAFTIDTIAPSTPIYCGPTGQIFPAAGSSRPTFVWSQSIDAGSGVARYELSIDGATPISVSGTTYTPSAALADGSHTAQVRAIDRAGNVQDTPAIGTFLLDSTAPDTTITQKPNDPSGSTSATFDFTGDDGLGI